MKLKAKDILLPTLVLFLICAVVTAALAGTNLLTAGKIQEQQLLNAEASRKIVLPGAESFTDESGYFSGLSGDEVVGYVFETESKGYGGTVRVMTGISSEGDITGVVVLSHNETPGLGANAEKDSFLSQFQQPVPSTGLTVVKYQTPKEGQVEALTGATITTKAVSDAVNQAIALYETEVPKS